MFKRPEVGVVVAVYLTEGRSRLLPLIILGRMNPTRCHHSTSLKIHLSVKRHLQKVWLQWEERKHVQFTPPSKLDLLVHLWVREGGEMLSPHLHITHVRVFGIWHPNYLLPDVCDFHEAPRGDSEHATAHHEHKVNTAVTTELMPDVTPERHTHTQVNKSTSTTIRARGTTTRVARTSSRVWPATSGSGTGESRRGARGGVTVRGFNAGDATRCPHGLRHTRAGAAVTAAGREVVLYERLSLWERRSSESRRAVVLERPNKK